MLLLLLLPVLLPLGAEMGVSFTLVMVTETAEEIDLGSDDGGGAGDERSGVPEAEDECVCLADVVGAEAVEVITVCTLGLFLMVRDPDVITVTPSELDPGFRDGFWAPGVDTEMTCLFFFTGMRWGLECCCCCCWGAAGVTVRLLLP